MFTRLQSFTQHFSEPTQVAWRVLLLLLLVPPPASAPRTDSAQAKPTISAEQAIAIATPGEVGENDFRISDMGAAIWTTTPSTPRWPTTAPTTNSWWSWRATTAT